MRSIVIALLSLLAPLACAQALSATQRDAVVAAYRALAPADVQGRPVDAAPAGKLERVDVSDKIRSASFGHTTTLLIPSDGKRFWVEYGKSTNRPASWYGPFAVSK